MAAVCYHYVVTILANPLEIEIPSTCRKVLYSNRKFQFYFGSIVFPLLRAGFYLMIRYPVGTSTHAGHVSYT